MLSILGTHRRLYDRIHSLFRQKRILRKTTSFIIDETETEALTEASLGSSSDGSFVSETRTTTVVEGGAGVSSVSSGSGRTALHVQEKIDESDEEEAEERFLLSDGTRQGAVEYDDESREEKEEEEQDDDKKDDDDACSSSPPTTDTDQKVEGEGEQHQGDLSFFVKRRAIPKFHRRELQLSTKLLGRGAFSEVYEVKGINVMKNNNSMMIGTGTAAAAATSSSSTETEKLARDDFIREFNNSKNQDYQEGGGDSSSSCPEDDYQYRPPVKLAMKHLSRKLLRRPKHFYQAALDLNREAYYLAQLDHPHILKLRASALGGPAAFSESGRYDGYFIVTDFLCDTLEQRINKWKRSWIYHSMEDLPKMIMKTQYASQLASALEYIHDRRIIFRDLKPDNIGFLHHSPHTLQLFDFGVCRTLPRSNRTSIRGTTAATTTATGTSTSGGVVVVKEEEEDVVAPIPEEDETFLMSFAGTTRYMAGEVLASGQYNLKADVHSYAMVLYEMYAEKKPFPTLRHDAFYDFVCRCKIRPPVTHLQLPKALEKLIIGAWCPSVEDRLSMKDISEVLPDILREMEAKMNTMTDFAEC